MENEKITKLTYKGKNIDGETYFTLETVLDAFRAGVQLGSKSIVSVTTNKEEER